MVDLIIALLLLTGSYISGWSSRYDPHVMQWQVDYHELELSYDLAVEFDAVDRSVVIEVMK